MTRKILIVIFSAILLYVGYDFFFGIDPNNPDCYGNKALFKKALKFESIPSDVSDIRCYSDHLGIDWAEEISFECDSSTALNIINTFHLRDISYHNYMGRYLYKSLRREIDSLPNMTDYKMKQKSPYHSFWYNPSNRHAYFLTYSM